MKELKKQLTIRWDMILFMLGLEFCLFVFGEILLLCVTQIFHQDEAFEIGTIMTLVATSSILIIGDTNTLALSFNTGISMGGTRRRLVPAYFIVSYLECLSASFFAFLLYQLETWILKTFYSGMEATHVVSQCFQPKYILTASLAITALNTVFGTLFLKFGKYAFIALWILWFLCFTILPRMGRILPKYQDTVWGRACMNLLSNLTEGRLIAGIAVLSFLLLLISWLMLRRQQVKL